MLEGGREAAADHVAQDVEDHHVGVLEHVVLLEELHGLADDITAAARASGRATRFDAFHAVEAFGHEILGAQLLGVEVDLLQDVDHRALEVACQREGRVVLRIAADLQDAVAQL